MLRHLTLAVTVATLIMVAAPPTRVAAVGLVVSDLQDGSLTPNSLAQTLVGSGVAIENASYTGSDYAAGTFTGGSGVLGIESGVVLSSGCVQTAAALPEECSFKGVEGPNEFDNTSGDFGTAGDSDLDALAGLPGDTLDAAVLEFDFVPTGVAIEFKYVFTSEEYNEFANGFNDVFGLFVNGTNCALVPGTDDPVGVNTVNGGAPYGVNPQHPEFYINNDLDDTVPASRINIEMDGLTTVLTCTAPVTTYATNTMKLAIADFYIGNWDSAVFIQARSIKASCSPAPFPDVPEAHPFCGEIKWMKDHEYSTGFPDGTYKPGNPVTRQAMAAFLARLSGDTLEPCQTPPFTDVPKTHTFCPHIKWMNDNQISTGFDDHTFRPSVPVTRQGMSAFMARFAGATLPPCSVAPFNDVPPTNQFCPHIKWMASNGVSRGFDNGSFGPTASVTRQAMSAFMFRLWVITTP
jgi:hypothetical protein